jgi:hypothetical protein
VVAGIPVMSKHHRLMPAGPRLRSNDGQTRNNRGRLMARQSKKKGIQSTTA